MAKKNIKNTQNNKKANIKNKIKNSQKSKKPLPARLDTSKTNKKNIKTKISKNKEHDIAKKNSSNSFKTITSKQLKFPKKESKDLAKIKNDKDKTKISEKILPIGNSNFLSQNKKILDQKLSTTKDEKSSKKRKGFKIGEFAVYPSHGVGKVIDLETINIGGFDVTSLVILFEKEKLTIRVPLEQIEKIGLRHIANESQMEEVFDILCSGVKKLKGMWSRRAQEYESKINSGNIILLAEVLRDLTRDIEDGERSYSERIIYETAIYRLALEYSVIANILFDEAKEKIISIAKNKIGDSTSNSESKAKLKDDFEDDFDAEEETEDEESEDEDYEEDE